MQRSRESHPSFARGPRNRYSGVAPFAIWLIRRKADRLVGRAGFSPSDREDLEQEIALDLLVRLKRFDPARATFRTFVVRVIDHKVADILEERCAAKRDWRRNGDSLDDLVDEEDGGRVERWQTLLGADGHDAEDRVDLRLDIEAALRTLPPALQEACEWLRNQSYTEASRATGIPRSTLQDRMKKVRAVFEKAGLDAYLSSPPANRQPPR
jgi:RNA polymerase sigma-70 factor (ECF subfamily)